MSSYHDTIQQLENVNVVGTQPKKTNEMDAQNVTAKYAQEFPAQRVNGFYGTMMNTLGTVIGTMGMIPCCICCPNPYKTVEQGTIGLVTRFGRYYKTVDPGLTRLNPYTESVQKVDMRVQISNIDHQVIMTKDNVNVHIDSIIYWHVIDPYQALYGVSDVRLALIERTKTTLRQSLGARLLQEIIENREQLAHEIQAIIDVPAHAWGVTVESILIKDIEFSKSLQESLSSAAQAKRLAESKVIQAQSEVDSAKLMRQAAEFLNTPAAMQIRYLESMASMARHSGQKTIFMPTADDAKTHFQATTSGGPGESNAAMPSISIAGAGGSQQVLLRLTLATLLVASAFTGPGTASVVANSPGGIKAFLTDPQIISQAPHLVQQISNQVTDTASINSDSQITPSIIQIPLLNDLIEIISQSVFNPLNTNVADWSRLEEAKVKAIQTQGEETVLQSSNLTSIDTHRASLIVNTIYDTVIHLPASNKAAYSAKSTNIKSTFWDIIGFGLIKSSDTIRGVKSVVTQQGVCNTMDMTYHKGVQEVIYYSSLTDGLAGSTMAAASTDPTVKSLNLGTIIGSVSKLAVEIHMAQSIARLADLDPADEHVRTMIYLALAADSPTADLSQAARDIFTMKTRGIASKIPAPALKALQRQATLVLITKGAGRVLGQNSFPDLPVVRNIFAFSSDVLSANNVGNVLKFVFCPGNSDEILAADEKTTATSAEKEEVQAAESVPEGEDGVEHEDHDEDDDEDDEDGDDEDGDDEDGDDEDGDDEDQEEENVVGNPESAPQSGDQAAFSKPQETTEEKKEEVVKQEL
ncbi:hypothetical protein BGX27_004373 [Mortierella sp. AM989]|nr:hypothetical protein BGX27_004373 [Mortierella sp. AM989]